MGDGYIFKFRNSEPTVDETGVPGVSFEFIAEDDIRDHFITDELEIDPITGTVTRFFENVFIKPIDPGHTIWFCVLDFNHGPTQVSGRFERLNTQLLDIHQRIARNKQALLKKKETIRKWQNQPHEQMKAEVALREISAQERQRPNELPGTENPPE